jgi:hypothetical protein
MTNTLSEEDWDILVESIKDKTCTPFIGAGACKGSLPLGSELAREWAQKFKYPLSDTGDLARVSQYLAVKKFEMYPKKIIEDRFQQVKAPNFAEPNEPHGLLAELPLPIYITTNYDSFMTLALKARNRDVKQELCRWNGFFQQDVKSVFFDEKNQPVDYKPTIASPLVYHLHGHYEVPQSLVLTEDDYLEFLTQISSNHTLLPTPVRKALSSTALLFIGYSLSDWNFRVLFRGLIASLGASLGFQSVAVQLAPASVEDSDESRRSAMEYLNVYLGKIQKIQLKVFWGDIGDFTCELRQRWEKAQNGNK